jgi:hypothetical protein
MRQQGSGVQPVSEEQNEYQHMMHECDHIPRLSCHKSMHWHHLRHYTVRQLHPVDLEHALCMRQQGTHLPKNGTIGWRARQETPFPESFSNSAQKGSSSGSNDGQGAKSRLQLHGDIT